jgi:flagellar biosynthesis/type III secretory pathway protein FliH|tara:strand:+ start:158 stop:337 length:180 start_codon:yes stop_codon:yes gene_type:complete
MKKPATMPLREVTEHCLEAMAQGMEFGREEGYNKGREEQRQKHCAYCGRDNNGMFKGHP